MDTPICSHCRKDLPIDTEEGYVTYRTCRDKAKLKRPGIGFNARHTIRDYPKTHKWRLVWRENDRIISKVWGYARLGKDKVFRDVEAFREQLRIRLGKL